MWHFCQYMFFFPRVKPLLVIIGDQRTLASVLQMPPPVPIPRETRSRVEALPDGERAGLN